MTEERITLHVCHGVDETMTCRFNGACYGEICIAPSVCRKAETDLTDEDRESMARVNDPAYGSGDDSEGELPILPTEEDPSDANARAREAAEDKRRMS